MVGDIIADSRATSPGIRSLKIRFGIRSGNRPENIVRHKEAAGEAVSRPFTAERACSNAPNLLGQADEDPAAIVMPVAELVAYREAPPPARTADVDGDDGFVGGPDDAGLASVKGPVSDPNTEVPGDRFKVELLRFGNAKPLEDQLRGRVAVHVSASGSSGDGSAPSS
jgi:hypothetical protein